MLQPNPSEVVGTILPEGRLGVMTRLGLLLRDGLPEQPVEPNVTHPFVSAVIGEEPASVDDAHCATGCNRPPEAPKPEPLYRGVVQYPPPFEWQKAIDWARRGLDDEGLAVARREYEAKADLEPLEFLLEYRRLIAQRLAPLSAMHRHAGKWDELRKAIRGRLKVELRRDNAKLSNDALEDLANGDERYLDALRIAYREAVEYEALSDELARLEARIEARKVANMQAIKEMGLQ